jgi:hypothetical protein
MRNILLFLIALLLLLNNCYSQWQPDYKLSIINAYNYTRENNSWQLSAVGNLLHTVLYDNRDGNYEIYYKRSTNAGISWGNDVRLTNAISNSEWPCLIACGTYLHVAWTDERDGDMAIYYKHSTDAGLSWEADMRLTDSSSYSIQPSITVTGNFVHLTWCERRDGNFEVYYKCSTDLGINWGTDTRLTNTPTGTYDPCIAVTGQNVHLIWYDTPAGNQAIYYRRSTDNGSTWSTEVLLTTNLPYAAAYPCLCSSGQYLHAVWLDNRQGNNEIYYKRSTNEGVNWGPDTRLTSTTTASWEPSVTASDSIVHVAWREQINVPMSNSDIYYIRSTNRGTSWESPVRLTDDPATSRYPSVAATLTGVHVVWYDTRDGNAIWYKRDSTGNLILPPYAPLLFSPPNNSQNQSITPLLDWDTVSYTQSFRVQASTDSLFSSVVLDSVIPVSQITVPSGRLTNDIKYFWRVKSSNILGEGPWSLIWNFRTITAPPLQAPNLISPPNNSNGQSVTPLLDWDSVANSSAFHVQVSADSMFGSTVLDTALSVTQVTVPAGRLSNYTLYYWKVRATNAGGNGPWSIIWNFRTTMLGQLQNENEIPKIFRLYNNCPNPFNPTTKIKFDIPPAGQRHAFDVRLTIYDLLGREVSVLVNEQLKPGTYEVQWDGTHFSSGIYFYKLIYGDYTAVKKMVLLK